MRLRATVLSFGLFAGTLLGCAQNFPPRSSSVPTGARPLYLIPNEDDQAEVAFDRANRVGGIVFVNGQFQLVPMAGSRVMVDVDCGGPNPVKMMLDTGSPLTVLDSRLFKDPVVGQLIPFGFPFAGGGGMGVRVNLGKVALGRSSQINFPVVIGDIQALRAQGEQIWGILGDDFLSHYKVTIDYKNQKIRLQ